MTRRMVMFMNTDDDHDDHDDNNYPIKRKHDNITPQTY